MPPGPPSPLTIRPFSATGSDYTAWLQVRNAVWEDEPTSAAVLRHEDTSWPQKHFSQRLLIEHEGTVVAVARMFENPWQYQAGKYDIELLVHPDRQGRGIGSAVYTHLLEVLHQRDPAPTSLVSHTREDRPRALAFLERRGFEVIMRWARSRLDLATFDADRFAGTLAQVERQGVTLHSVAELAKVEPDWQRKFYEMDLVAGQDAPSPDPMTPEPFEMFVKNNFESPQFLPAGTFVAIGPDGTWLGSTEVADSGGGEHLSTPFTCVHPDYRRRGIATAMKIRAAQFAQAYGARSITTGNEENNPMYLINLRLGFKPLPQGLTLKTGTVLG